MGRPLYCRAARTVLGASASDMMDVEVGARSRVDDVAFGGFKRR